MGGPALGGRSATSPLTMMLSCLLLIRCSLVEGQPDTTPLSWPVKFNAANQPVVRMQVGRAGQHLDLVFATGHGNLLLFLEKPGKHAMYDATGAHGSLRACKENNRVNLDARKERIECWDFLQDFVDANNYSTRLYISGVLWQNHLGTFEAVDEVAFPHSPMSRRYPVTVAWHGLRVNETYAKEKNSAPADVDDLLFKDTGGIIGCAGPAVTHRLTTACFQFFMEQDIHYYALELDHANREHSSITFNHIKSHYRNNIIWSETWQDNGGTPEFMMYHMEICGADVMGNTSSHWKAVIDTSGPCLTLPTLLYDRVMAQIQLSDPRCINSSDQGDTCVVPTSTSLPDLTFTLSDIGDPMPQRLTLSLADLVLDVQLDAPSSTITSRLCIRRQVSAFEKDIKPKLLTDPRWDTHWYMNSPPVLLGSMALKSLYTVVDVKSSKVGFSNKRPAAAPTSHAGCKPRASCIGSQKYWAAGNLCEDPVCSSYLFMSLDDQRKECRCRGTFIVTICVVIATLAIMDFVSHAMYKKAIRKASVWLS